MEKRKRSIRTSEKPGFDPVYKMGMGTPRRLARVSPSPGSTLLSIFHHTSALELDASVSIVVIPTTSSQPPIIT
jgi:hypothetical protein